MMRHPRPHGLASLLAAIVLAVVLAGIVSAHAELKTPSPADKSTSTQPVTVVSGIFTEAMKTQGSGLIVKDSVDSVVAEGTVDSSDTKRMVATPATPLGTGSYLVQWTAVATDGHVERGTWTFKVAVATTPSPTPVPTATPAAAATASPTPSPTAVPATPAPSAGPTPAPSGGGHTTGSGGDVALPIVVALIVLGAGAAYLLTRRNRPSDAT